MLSIFKSSKASKEQPAQAPQSGASAPSPRRERKREDERPPSRRNPEVMRSRAAEIRSSRSPEGAASPSGSRDRGSATGQARDGSSRSGGGSSSRAPQASSSAPSRGAGQGPRSPGGADASLDGRAWRESDIYGDPSEDGRSTRARSHRSSSRRRRDSDASSRGRNDDGDDSASDNDVGRSRQSSRGQRRSGSSRRADRDARDGSSRGGSSSRAGGGRGAAAADAAAGAAAAAAAGRAAQAPIDVAHADLEVRVVDSDADTDHEDRHGSSSRRSGSRNRDRDRDRDARRDADQDVIGGRTLNRGRSGRSMGSSGSSQDVRSRNGRGDRADNGQPRFGRSQDGREIRPAVCVALGYSLPHSLEFICTPMAGPDGRVIVTLMSKDGKPIPVATDERGHIMVDRDGQPLPLDPEGKPVPLGNDGRVLKPLQPVPVFTMFMVAGCLAGFGMTLWQTGGIAPLSVNPTVGPSAEAMVACGAKVTYLIYGPAQELVEAAQPSVAAQWCHSLGVQYVPAVEVRQVLECSAGHLKYATLYILSGIFSVVVSATFAPGAITVGASGAIFGIFGAFLAELLQNWHLIPTMKERCMAFTSLLMSLAVNLAIGLLPFIDNYAHIGGLVAGMLLGFPMLVYTKRKGQGCTTSQFFLGALGVLAFLVALAAGLLAVSQGWGATAVCHTCVLFDCVPSPWWTCPDLSGNPVGYGPSPEPSPSPSTTPTFNWRPPTVSGAPGSSSGRLLASYGHGSGSGHQSSSTGTSADTTSGAAGLYDNGHGSPGAGQELDDTSAMLRGSAERYLEGGPAEHRDVQLDGTDAAREHRPAGHHNPQPSARAAAPSRTAKAGRPSPVRPQ